MIPDTGSYTKALVLLAVTAVMANAGGRRDSLVNIMEQLQDTGSQAGIKADTNNNLKVVCYYTNWSQYRNAAGKFWPEDIDVSLCTHLLYAFAKLEGGVLAPVEWNDESTQWSKGLYERFNDLKAKKPGLKTLLSVGGWNMGSASFSEMVSTPSTRKTFIDHAVTYLRKRNFDGLDIDWEYPTQRGGQPADKDLLTQLLKELMAAFQAEATQSGKDRLLLTMAVGAGKFTIDSAYDVPGICQSVDFLNIMGYDFHGAFDQPQVTGLNSPLYPRINETGTQATMNQDYAVRYWISKGAPAGKLVLGLGLYGRSFTLSNPSSHDVGSPFTGPGLPGDFTQEGGILAYYEICQRLINGWQLVFDNEQKSCYAYKDNQWVGFDDPQSVQIKMNYIKEKQLAGAMTWSLDLDDFHGQFCQKGTYPLLSEINRNLGRI